MCSPVALKFVITLFIVTFHPGTSVQQQLPKNIKNPFETWNIENGAISSVYATIGGRPYMEDYSIRIENSFGIGIFAIIDGHAGNYSANFTKDYLTNEIPTILHQHYFDPENCEYTDGPNAQLNVVQMLTALISDVEHQLETAMLEHKHRSGTTCVLIIAENAKLTVANVGDSRGVMCTSNGTAINLSIDHKPMNKKETRRITDAHGEIIFKYGAWRVHGLSMSRSLGDYQRKANNNVLISKPDIFRFDLNEYRPRFMILASDGLWDVMTSQEAVNFIKSRYLRKNDFGAKALAKRAIQLNSMDNITVLIVVFKNGFYEIGQS